MLANQLEAAMRHVLITGANRGIGLAIVRELLARADELHVFLGSRSVERGQAAKAALVEEQPAVADRITQVQLDVSSDPSVQAAADQVREQAGALYGLVNNAGIGFGESSMARVLDVNTRGPRRVCEAFLELVQSRIVNISSASGPNFVADCSSRRQEQLTKADITWPEIEGIMEEALAIERGDGDFASAGLGSGSAYGLSKACLNAYTLSLARRRPELVVNACTPGFIETDLTRPYAESQGVSPASLGMKPPAHGAQTPVFLLLGDPGGTGWYFGSDQQRSPLDRYRAPGDPPYTGE